MRTAKVPFWHSREGLRQAGKREDSLVMDGWLAGWLNYLGRLYVRHLWSCMVIFRMIWPNSASGIFCRLEINSTIMEIVRDMKRSTKIFCTFPSSTTIFLSYNFQKFLPWRLLPMGWDLNLRINIISLQVPSSTGFVCGCRQKNETASLVPEYC